MDQHNAMVFPSVGMHVLSATIHFLGVSILAHLISRRAMLSGASTLRDVSWPSICVLLILIDSWLFIFSSGLLILGFGLERNDVSCSMGILLCILFYGTSKLFIYIFLSERVYVVWQPTPQSRRLQCKAYIGCIVALCGYGGVVGMLFYGRISFFGDKGACYIGLKKSASITLLAYDFFVNAVLTGLFLWPVMRGAFLNSRVKRLAVRTLWSALIALTTSCVNILILTLMHGRQLGWVCLASCGTDVIVNALVVYWVTLQCSDQHDRVHGFIPPSRSEGPESGGTYPSHRASKVSFKLGHSQRSPPAGLTSMQIKVTTERIDEHGESSADGSEYELQKVSISPNEVREESRSPELQK